MSQPTEHQVRAETRIMHDVAMARAAQYRLRGIIEQVLAGDFDYWLENLADAVAMRLEARDQLPPWTKLKKTATGN